MVKIRRRSLVVLSLVVLCGCDIVIRQIGPTPTPVPTSQPGSACSAVSVDRLQRWMAEKFPRLGKQIVGGTVYLDTPQITNCAEDTAYFQVRVGYERKGFLIEMGLLEDHFDLLYDAGRGTVCLDLHSILSSAPLAAQGLEQVGQAIKLADVQGTTAKSVPEGLGMPADVSQQFEEAVAKSYVEGVGPQEQGIGTEAAGVLMNWSVGELLEQFNNGLAGLIGACISTD